MNELQFSPKDVAIFAWQCDLTQKQLHLVRNDLWVNRSESLTPFCNKSKFEFIREIDDCIIELRNPNYCNEICEINKVLSELGFGRTIETKLGEQEILTTYFKVIKLRLLYQERYETARIKLRRLLKALNYKRRSSLLINQIKIIMKGLGLSAFGSGRVPCDISTMNLDSMIMIRLSSDY